MDDTDKLTRYISENKLIDSTFLDYLIKDSGVGLSKNDKKYLRNVILNRPKEETETIKLDEPEQVIIRLLPRQFKNQAFLIDSMLEYLNNEPLQKPIEQVIVYHGQTAEERMIFLDNAFRIFEKYVSDKEKFETLFSVVRNILDKNKSYLKRDHKDLKTNLIRFLFLDEILYTVYKEVQSEEVPFTKYLEMDWIKKNDLLCNNILKDIVDKKIEIINLGSPWPSNIIENKYVREILKNSLIRFSIRNFLIILNDFFNEELNLNNLYDNIKNIESDIYIKDNFKKVMYCYIEYQIQMAEEEDHILDNYAPHPTDENLYWDKYSESYDLLPAKAYITSNLDNFKELLKITENENINQLLRYTSDNVLLDYLIKNQDEDINKEIINRIDEYLNGSILKDIKNYLPGYHGVKWSEISDDDLIKQQYFIERIDKKERALFLSALVERINSPETTREEINKMIKYLRSQLVKIDESQITNRVYKLDLEPYLKRD